MDRTILKMTDIVKDFGDLRVVKGVSLTVSKGETVAIIGPSGSGKSTLLRCINGLNKVTSGNIELNGETGMVFQHFNLFPHMTCLENITYAPVKVKGMDKEEKNEDARYIRQERYSGACSRSFFVGEVKPADVKCKYEFGVLKITIPKTEAALAQPESRIAIE